MPSCLRVAGSLLLVAGLAVLGAGACAQGSVVPVGTGQGASIGTSSAATGGAGASGGGIASGGGTTDGGPDAASDAPVACLHQSDCVAVSDACNLGDCLNNVCVKTPANDGSPCDDGLFCTVNDVCSMGVCSGVPKDCTANDPCMTGNCDEAAKMCNTVPGNDGAPCNVPNNLCFLGGSCSGGTCMGTTPTNCAFLNGPCSGSKCDPMLGCQKVPVADGTVCTTNNFCIVSETCQAGSCTGTPKVCPPLNGGCQINTCNSLQKACTVTQAPNGTSCSTMDVCLSGETCTAGVCSGGVPANQGMTCKNASACVMNSACNAGACSGSPVTACVSGDGCCPPGCTPSNDSDCNCAVDLALTATGVSSGGGAPTMYGPEELNNGIDAKTDCSRFCWVNSGAGAFFELDWPAPVTIASFYVSTVNPQTPPSCSFAVPGRNLASATVEWWNGSAWVTATSFTGQTGNIQINLPSPVTTTKLRLANAVPGSSNPLIFEWYVYAAPNCMPP